MQFHLFGANQNNQEVLLAPNLPGKIIEWDLEEGPIVTTRGSFVAAFGPKIDISAMVAKRAGAAFFANWSRGRGWDFGRRVPKKFPLHLLTLDSVNRGARVIGVGIVVEDG